MKILIFGATGMVGQGVLRESLRAADVARVQTVGRSNTGERHLKLGDVVHQNLFDLSEIERDVTGFDACFFCLGVSSAGMPERDYRRLTFDLTLSVARTLARLNPGMTFIFVSGAGTDSSERGRIRWARVKGRTENTLLKLPFRAVYLFRPGIIQPLHGARSKTKAIRLAYQWAGPLLGLARRIAPRWIVTTEVIGLAMLNVARHGASKAVLEPPDIEAAAQSGMTQA